MAQPSPEPTDGAPPRLDAETAERRLTTLPAQAKPAPVRRTELPAPVRKAAKAVVVGAALQVGASLAMRYLARHAGKQGTAAVAAKGLRAATRRRPAPATARDDAPVVAPEDAEIVSETLLVRRVLIRRKQG